MSETSFFWHDYETFGRDPRLDRPAQFAGIRTDLDLNEVGEPVMLYCQPAPDYLPDPEACLLTGILPQECLARGLPEYRFADAVLAELGASGTIGVGYNSIRFDDEVTRHLLWRTLRPPYDREWRNGCSRWDLLDVVRATAALRPEGIEWPRHDDGRPSFRLEHLSAANGLIHAQAHDALSDVRATIALAGLIRSRQPRLWSFCLALRHKQAVQEQIGADRPFIHISAMYGAERGGMAVVWPLAQHPTNRNELIVWDLAQDPAELAGLDPEQIRLRLFSKTEELPEGTTRLPIKSVHINRSPVVIGNLKVLTPAVITRWQMDMEAIARHTRTAQQLSAQLAERMTEVYRRPRQHGPAPDVDGDLYGGFLGNDDRRRLDDWRERLDAVGSTRRPQTSGASAMSGMSGTSAPTAPASTHPETIRPGNEDHFPGEEIPPDAIAPLPGSLRETDHSHVQVPSFEDPRLEELSFRYRARQFPAILSTEEQQRWVAHCHARLHNGAGNAMTLASYAERLDELNQSLSPDDEHGQRLLEALYDYGERLA